MFTGIITDLGYIAELESHGSDLRVRIRVETLNLRSLNVGDSIAVNGVCLTVTAIDQNIFAADISAETLARTTLGQLKVGSRTNLETALTPASALGGHLVNGHVDGVGEVQAFRDDGRSTRYEFSVPVQLSQYIAPKGSIAIDGVSLTVNTVDGNRFSVNIIPHTLDKTVFADYRAGSRVNLEVDIIARYLERLLSARN
jgi:riboflavin synthase